MKLPSTSEMVISEHAAEEKQRPTIRFAPVAFLEHPNRVFASFAPTFPMSSL
jgi:hypothetical protein